MMGKSVAAKKKARRGGAERAFLKIPGSLFGCVLRGVAGGLGGIASGSCGVTGSFLGFRAGIGRSSASGVGGFFCRIDGFFSSCIDSFAGGFNGFAGFFGCLVGFLRAAGSERGEQNRSDRYFGEFFHATFLPGWIPVAAS
jgi:hypothetical protein